MNSASPEGDRRRAPLRRACPLCGRLVVEKSLHGHVGGRDCIVRLHGRGQGELFDPVRGPGVMAAVRALSVALGVPGEATP